MITPYIWPENNFTYCGVESEFWIAEFYHCNSQI